jgi:menaquinone-dependent protoporphyrinogen oxidase
MTAILITYSSHDGHTAKICRALQQEIEGTGTDVKVAPLADADTIDLGGFDKVVIGASIKYGKHKPEVAAYIHKHLSVLESKTGAFFSVNAVARKPTKNSPETNPYLKKFLRHIAWKPKHLAVFGGKIDYPRYSKFDRFIIRLIMWITNGPTDPTACIEFTDWDKVRAFALQIAESTNKD